MEKLEKTAPTIELKGNNNQSVKSTYNATNTGISKCYKASAFHKCTFGLLQTIHPSECLKTRLETKQARIQSLDQNQTEQDNPDFEKNDYWTK